MDSPDCRTKVNQFIANLKPLGYSVTKFAKMPQVYSIDGRLVNVRCRRKARITDSYGSRSFWYDVSFRVLNEVDWVLYLMTEPSYFVNFPAAYLSQLSDQMYAPSRSRIKGVFDIRWDDLTLGLRDTEVDISAFAGDLMNRESYPRF